ncbi:oligosaccharide flippase family protein [Empedobacter falsenii]
MSYLKPKVKNVFSLLKNNKKIIENYFFMTILQVLNSFFYLLIYPYLIRTLGAEGYGLFIFASSIATYFVFLINFGFDLPATKSIAENLDNHEKIEDTLSSIFTTKIYLFIISTIIFSILLFVIPMFRLHLVLFFLCFLTIISFIIFPQWYFQGIQQMRIVTYIQIGFKLVSLPLIFLMVKNPEDLNLYALIVSLSSLFGGLVAYIIIVYKNKVRLRFVSFQQIKPWLKEGFPFFLSNFAGIIKEQSITIIIGAFFGMRDVAIYDLANKLILIPRTLFMSINGAIFPKLINNITNEKVKKILKVESILSLSVILAITFFGKFIIQIMGGDKMLDAYPIAILLSVTVVTWLVVGAYISFVFIPKNKYFLVTKNQLIALLSFIIYMIIGLTLFKSILVFGAAIALSGITEIIYCIYVTKRNKLL